jgi:hypothetical protein
MAPSGPSPCGEALGEFLDDGKAADGRSSGGGGAPERGFGAWERRGWVGAL